MTKNIVLMILAVMLFAGQPFAEAATKTKDQTVVGKQPKEGVAVGQSVNPLDKVSKEDVLDRVNGILLHNPQILEALPEIQKEVKGKETVFKVGGKEMTSLSKDELIVVLKKINPVLSKIQQERTKKQVEQLVRQNQQNMQIQRMVQQQSQTKPPSVFTPPAKQPTPPTPYRPPAAQPAPPRR
ncbi:MAG: hypothetical protein WCK38_01710 [Candidatus Omnitrophota bacterium]